jgi:hypothetical protein
MVRGQHTPVGQNPDAESTGIGAIGKRNIIQVWQLCTRADVVTLNMLTVGCVKHRAPIRREIHPPCTDVVGGDIERLQQVSGGIELQNPAEALPFGNVHVSRRVDEDAQGLAVVSTAEGTAESSIGTIDSYCISVRVVVRPVISNEQISVGIDGDPLGFSCERAGYYGQQSSIRTPHFHRSISERDKDITRGKSTG